MTVSNYLRLKEMYNGNPDLISTHSKSEFRDRLLEQQAQKELENQVPDSVAKMCSTTNLNVTRIRNYINGKVLYLSPEEERIINEYCHSLLNQTRRS